MERRTRLSWDRAPDRLEPGIASFMLRLDPQETTQLELTVTFDIERRTQVGRSHETALAAIRRQLAEQAARECHIVSANTMCNRWIRRSIEGVPATGMRTTTTIPAGAIGNLLPIEIVAERWFSEELQVPLLITRRDPRAGDSVYRLTNIVRGDPPDYLFTVPPGYGVREGKLGPYTAYAIKRAEQQKK